MPLSLYKTPWFKWCKQTNLTKDEAARWNYGREKEKLRNLNLNLNELLSNMLTFIVSSNMTSVGGQLLLIFFLDWCGFNSRVAFIQRRLLFVKMW